MPGAFVVLEGAAPSAPGRGLAWPNHRPAAPPAPTERRPPRHRKGRLVATSGEKLLHRCKHQLARADALRGRRQRSEEDAPVAFIGEPAVEHQHAAAVGAAPDQPAEPLLEFDDRLRQCALLERIAAARRDRFDARLFERLGGDAKGQAGDDDAAQGVARNVDALPEAVGGEQHRARLLEEAGEQYMAAELALAQRGAARLTQYRGELV